MPSSQNRIASRDHDRNVQTRPVVLKLELTADVGGSSALTPTFTVALAASCITASGSSRYRSFLQRRTANKHENKA